MAAVKPELLKSQLVGMIATKFQRLPHVFWVKQHSGAIVNTVRLTGREKLRMTATKPEVLIAFDVYTF